MHKGAQHYHQIKLLKLSAKICRKVLETKKPPLNTLPWMKVLDLSTMKEVDRCVCMIFA